MLNYGEIVARHPFELSKNYALHILNVALINSFFALPFIILCIVLLIYMFKIK